MAWTAPMTATLNGTFTAAEWNTHIRDNLLETEAAKAATVDSYLVSTGANAITERAIGSDFVEDFESTHSTSYTDLHTPGPSVTVTTGTRAIVWISAAMMTNKTNRQMVVSYEVSGDTSISASDNWAIITDGVTLNWNIYYNPFDQHNRRGIARLETGLTPGSNTFTMKYRVGSARGYFHNREIDVMPL